MLYLLAAAGILIGVILISSFISSEITKPLRRLRDSMSLVEKGDFEQASVEITAENEIGSLSKSFNAMTQKIHALMEQNIYEQKQKRKSEMKALQAQINPHFLYNTLDSIIWMSEAGENDQVVLMTSALAKLLRQSIIHRSIFFFHRMQSPTDKQNELLNLMHHLQNQDHLSHFHVLQMLLLFLYTDGKLIRELDETGTVTNDMCSIYSTSPEVLEGSTISDTSTSSFSRLANLNRLYM